MAQSKEEKKRKAREKYAAGKGQGLTRSQLRSIKKAAAADENVLEKAAGIFGGLVKELTEALENVADDILKDGQLGKSSSKGRISSSKGFPSGKGGGKGRGGGGGKGGKPPRSTKEQRQKDFERYAKRKLKENPNLPARQLRDMYRKNTGRKINQVDATRIIRETKGKPEKDVKKVTRTRYFGTENNPNRIKHGKERYLYIVEYTVNQNGTMTTRRATIASPDRLNRREVTEELYMLVDELQSTRNMYGGMEIVDGSVKVLYAIDTEKKK